MDRITLLTLLLCVLAGCGNDGTPADAGDSGLPLGCVPGQEFRYLWDGGPLLDCNTSLAWELPPHEDDCLTLGFHYATIDELRTLVRGCPATEPGGSCALHDGTTDIRDYNDACMNGCAFMRSRGPGVNGCFQDPAFPDCLIVAAANPGSGLEIFQLTFWDAQFTPLSGAPYMCVGPFPLELDAGTR